ncbi:PP2C family serine/threonine-protein phosphatase [uncultured Clostridium sp.]|uniref:PP2C family protein-serine/threonine phosphatase n=1 Tax=uncultured Clostridium sp. TaxID=59620 RepID=UPI0025FF88AE|nr:PP2C family serine/threonine-protein phosphatase [uncultured Clostridium sp.]
MNYLIGYYSDKGIRKEVNQDALLIKTCKSPYGRIGLFIVCDGVGGLQQGEIASSTVIKMFSNWFDNDIKNINFENLKDEEIFSVINELIIDANRRIIEYGQRNNCKLGTTLTLMLTVDEKYYIYHVGDSRIYKVSHNLEILTKDQTLVAREIELGNLTEEEAKIDSRRSVLLQCIGAKYALTPEFSSGELSLNEVYIICSDGFYRRLEKSELINELSSKRFICNNDLNNKARELVFRAMDRKEADNISVILIKTIN